MKLQIWDTAGEERFRNITKIYFRGAQGILLLYDQNCDETFQNIRKHWKTQVKELAEKDSVVCLVANKKDLSRKVNKTLA